MSRWILPVAAVLLGPAVAGAKRCPEACALMGVDRTRTALVGDQDVPTNARIIGRGGPHKLGAPPPPPVLRRRGGDVVACDASPIPVDGGEFFELRPRAGLAADADYEVVMRDLDEEKVARFRTGAGPDDRPPVWDGIKGARYEPPSSCAVSCFYRRDALVELTVARAREDRMGGEDVIYELWIAAGGAKIDYTRPPFALRAAKGIDEHDGDLGLGPRTEDLLVIGGARRAGAPDQLPRGARKLRIGVRARDAAGNATAPAETVVVIPRGIAPPDW